MCREFNSIYSESFIEISDKLTLKASSSIAAQEVLNDVDAICRFCLKNKIDYIDCHPFWCALPASLAANQLGIPISFTLHGEISANFISNKHLAAQALYDTVFSYGFDQIFAVAEYLTELYSYLPNIKIVRNGLPINRLESQSFKNTKKVAIASRLDEPKTKLIIDFLPTIYDSKAVEQVDIYGDGDHAEELKTFIAKNNMSNKINLCGWTKDFAQTIASKDYMLVLGMGRVVLEAMKSGVPVGILGYGGFAGFVNRNNLLDFSKNNLTSWQESTRSFSTELKHLFKNPSNYFFKSSQLSIFNIESIWQQYYDFIKNIKHVENQNISTLYEWLSIHPNSNVFNDQELLLTCVRTLSDSLHPISPRLFYNLFQSQIDRIHDQAIEIEKLNSTNSILQQEVNLSLKEIAKKRLKARTDKIIHSNHHT